MDFKNLRELTIPDSVIKIGKRAFVPAYDLDENRFSLHTLQLGNGVRTIGAEAFSDNNKMQKITFGSALEEIGSCAFECNKSIKEVMLDQTRLMRLGDKAFYNCESLKKLTLPETLLHIGDSAFKGCSQLDPFELPAQLQYIGRDAFRDAAIDVVRLPKTMMRVERSAFAGARELIVYDNIEPDAVEADQWNFDSLNGTINAPFACALISIWSKSADNIGSTDWKGFHITVLSAQTDQVKYRIYCDGSEHHEYLALMFSAWGRYASFKFLEYDNFFGKLSNATTRIETAFCRLQFPFGLAAHHREEYETYLQQATYFQTNATLVAEAIADKDEVERLQMLLDLRALSQRNTDWLMSIFQEAKATKCINLLQQSKI